MLVYKGDKNQRKALQYRVRKGDFQVLLTTYDYVIKDKAVLSKTKWVYMNRYVIWTRALKSAAEYRYGQCHACLGGKGKVNLL